jgi:hypothetical protein
MIIVAVSFIGGGNRSTVENHRPAAAAVRNRLLYTILKRNTPNLWCKGFSALNLVGHGFKSQFKGQPKDYKIGTSVQSEKIEWRSEKSVCVLLSE